MLPSGGAATRQRAIALALLTLLAAPSLLADQGSAFDRSIERLVATPTPVGPLLLASDQSSWRVDVPGSTIVTVEAGSADTAPFTLRAQRVGAAEQTAAIPTTHAGFILPGPDAWKVSVDPVGGVAVNITIRFRGHVGSDAGGPASFELTDLAIDHGCLFADVCLP